MRCAEAAVFNLLGLSGEIEHHSPGLQKERQDACRFRLLVEKLEFCLSYSHNMAKRIGGTAQRSEFTLQ
jgi:hypothetical protein